MKKKQIIVASISTLNVWAESFISEEVFERIKNNPEKIKSFEKDMGVTVTTARDADDDCMLSVRKDLPSATSEDFESLEGVLNRLIATVEGWKSPKSKEASQDKRQEYVEFCKAILGKWNEFPSTCGAAIYCKFESKIVTIPVSWICGDLLQKLLQCYVEHNS